MIVDRCMLYLGVVHVNENFKGKSALLVLILPSNPNLIISDQLKIQSGITGLWLLQKAKTLQLKHVFQVHSPLH